MVDGKLRSLEPRFRGHEVVEPQANEIDAYAFSHWNALDDNAVQFTTRTWGNPTTSTASTQGMCLEIEASPATRLTGIVNEQAVDVPLAALVARSIFPLSGWFSVTGVLFSPGCAAKCLQCQLRVLA